MIVSIICINLKSCKLIQNFVQFYNRKLAPMGIEGLLKFLDPITVREHISTFQGKTAAVDIMSWLYKGCYRCAFELNQNIESNNFLYYIFEMLDLLNYYDIKPFCVFDGKYVGKKEETLEKRKRNKEENKKRGLDYLAIGNQEEARKYLSRCIVIDQRIIATTMRALHTKGVKFMVAPYESDSQIAKILNLGMADFAITEDSDLVAYGLKVVLKLNTDGDCDYIDLSRWTPDDVDSTFLKQYLQLTYVGRLQTAVLSGTDYNSSINGIGIKRATKKISLFKNMIDVVTHLRESKTYSEKVPENYQKTITESKLIFLLATTYNPLTDCLQYLNNQYLQEFLPKMIEEDIQNIVGKRYNYSEDVRLGRVNLKTLQKREIFNIDIKTVFTISSSNLQSRELINIQRRAQDAIARQKRMQERKNMAQNNNIENITPSTQQRKKKVQPPKIILSQQERKKQMEQRKAERTKRFNDFKQVLNNFIIQEDSQSVEQESSSQIIRQENQPKEERKDTAKKNTSDEQVEAYSDSESNDNSCLQYLNPWLKS